ncbi:MAG: TonB-dependent receptor [Flavobacteriales bacterium]
MKNILFILSAFFIGDVGAQQLFTISGQVRSAATGEASIGALVVAKEINEGQAADVYGYYSLTLREGTHTIEYSYLGFETQAFIITLNQDVVKDVELMELRSETDAVIVEADKSRNTQSTDLGKVNLDVDAIKKLPVLLGEVDILKTITLLPGVRSSGEGNAGFYVRGGGVDQNLILLDNATVYNASHLFGFFSVFNADAVKNLELTKGGVPANFGGRLASVLDIQLKEGNSKEMKVQGGIGTIASRLTIEGPIKKDVSSFIISARRTYIDVLMKPFIKPESNFAGSGYYFYDLNAKLNYRLSPSDQLFASAYFGRDVFTFKSKQTNFGTRIPWGNATGTLRWNHIITQKLFMNVMATFTDYRFAFEGDQEEFEFKLSSGIQDVGAKVQWNYFPNYLHNMRWGVEYVHHNFTPNSVYARSGDTEFDTGPEVHLLSHEAAAYLLEERDITENLRINAGLRISHFIHTGPFTRYIAVDDDNLGTPAAPQEINYTKHQKVKTYTGMEPRANLRYTINRQSSLKAGYMRNYQYIHLTSLSPTSLPTDVWLPSTEVTQPQIGQQISAGYFRNLDNDAWETSIEAYYKTMQNQAEYKEGAAPEQTVNDNIDNLLVFGKGWSYGVELFVKKRTGKLNGWIGYTWSKTQRQLEEINGGRDYYTRWDRRHDMSFVLNYKVSKRLDFGFVFVYATGQPITIPVERYFFETYVMDRYIERNAYRMAAYHRADASLTIHARESRKITDPETGVVTERKKRVQSSWNFSVYNLYNRKNPYFIYFGNDGQLSTGTIQVKAYQVSLFPVLPGVTWNFEF